VWGGSGGWEGGMAGWAGLGSRPPRLDWTRAGPHRYLYDMRPGDVVFTTADCGWITGHTYLAYGPLLCGCGAVVLGGIPT
jgi:hypothetical protein